MSTLWLAQQLMKADGVKVDGDAELLKVTLGRRTELVYCPASDEYIVTADVVGKAKELGATIVAYPTSWASATIEAKGYAKGLGISVMPYNTFFSYLRRKGVEFRS